MGVGGWWYSILAVSIGACLASAVWAQGTISGAVLSALQKVPLAGSKVTLSLADGSQSRSTVADRGGRFLFENLPPGLYRVSASRPYFAAGRYGQKAWNRAGKTIELAPRAGFSAEVLLHRLGVITGAVVDENGEGIPDVKVRALTAYADRRPGRIAAEGSSDDRGNFRIAGLKPGLYCVATAPHESPDGLSFLVTYYPQHLGMTESRTVEVQIDQETSHVQIQPVAGKLLRLAGRVTSPLRITERGAPIVHLLRDDDSQSAPVDPQGNFAFTALAPGRYTLMAEVTLSLPPMKLTAYQQVDLERDTEGLALGLAPAPDVRVRLVDEKDADLNDPQVLIFLARAEVFARAAPVRLEKQRGPLSQYLAAALLPGQWRFYVVAPEAYVLESVMADAKDVLGGLSLLPGQRVSATMRLARRAGQLRGRVLEGGDPSPGVAVFCYPLDPQNRHRLGGHRTLRTNLRGEYRFGGLPEGEYLVFSSTLEDFSPEDRVEELRSRVSSVKLTAGGDRLHDVRLIE